MGNKQIILRYFTEIWNGRSKSTAYEIVSEKLKTRFPTTHGNGLEGLMKLVASRYEAFPDLKFEVIDVVC